MKSKFSRNCTIRSQVKSSTVTNILTQQRPLNNSLSPPLQKTAPNTMAPTHTHVYKRLQKEDMNHAVKTLGMGVPGYKYLMLRC